MNNFKALITLGLIYLSLFNFYWIVSNQTELRNNVQIVQEGKLITDLQEFHWEELLNNQNGKKFIWNFLKFSKNVIFHFFPQVVI